MAGRAGQPFEQRLSIYEVHLGSWRRVPEDGDRPLSYREAGVQLAEYCTDLGFTHVELLPVAEHPFGGSWGYQVSGYFAPTARFGGPDDLRAMVDTLHQAGIGVIVDWVPAHFPTRRVRAGSLRRHQPLRARRSPPGRAPGLGHVRLQLRPQRGPQLPRGERAVLVGGVPHRRPAGRRGRLDALPRLLTRPRASGSPTRTAGGRTSRRSTCCARSTWPSTPSFPGVLTIAEESTAWPGVTRPVDVGGLGFTHKWNMGWMHDTLEYFAKDPLFRSYEHDKLTFGLLYAWSENFILPLSHDEVVHGKGSLLGKMPGDRWQKLANLRALYGWMWAHPGKKLLFMGSELGQEREWSHDRSLDWHLLEERRPPRPVRPGGRAEPAGRRARGAVAGGLLAARASAGSTPATGRRRSTPSPGAEAAAASRRRLVCVANLTPVPRPGYRVGLPGAGTVARGPEHRRRPLGRIGRGQPADRGRAGLAWQDCKRSAVVTLPPLGVVWLSSRPSAATLDRRRAVAVASERQRPRPGP